MSLANWIGVIGAKILQGLRIIKKEEPKPTEMPTETKPVLITGDEVRKISTSLNIQRSEELADLINDACNRYGVTSFDQLDEPLANLFQESLEFKHKKENMNYSAKRLVVVWPNRFPTIASAAPYANNPQALANKTYGRRMGNVNPNDGYDFLGGGFIGLTGREVYTKYAKYIGKDVLETAELVRNSDYYALDSAFWFIYVLKGLKDEAERDEFIGIVKSINGGVIGLKDRQFYYNRIKALNK